MSSKSLNRATGKLGESIGETYLKKQGYRVLERNVRSPFGEIDLIAQHKGTLVFIEIKTRRSSEFGFPEEAVTTGKKRRLIQLARWYLARYQKTEPAVRFDVLAIELKGEKPLIRLIQNAIEADA